MGNCQIGVEWSPIRSDWPNQRRRGKYAAEPEVAAIASNVCWGDRKDYDVVETCWTRLIPLGLESNCRDRRHCMAAKRKGGNKQLLVKREIRNRWLIFFIWTRNQIFQKMKCLNKTFFLLKWYHLDWSWSNVFFLTKNTHKIEGRRSKEDEDQKKGCCWRPKHLRGNSIVNRANPSVITYFR